MKKKQEGGVPVERLQGRILSFMWPALLNNYILILEKVVQEA